MSYNEQLPKWDEPGTEPPESKKLAGWGISEKPPAGWFDWLFNRIYKVLSELQLKAAEKADVGDMSTVPTASKNAAGAITELHNEIGNINPTPADGSITDVKIGTRTIDDTVAAAAGADTPTRLWSKLANMIKAITGKANWYTAPVTTIEALNNAMATKLNSAAYTAADVLAKLKTVDGVGSGVDAETVGGKHATDFQNNTKVYGNMVLADTVNPGQTITKLIPLGSNIKNARLTFNGNGNGYTNQFGIMVLCGTDNLKTLVVGTIGVNGASAWSRRWLGRVTNASYGYEALGNVNMQLLEVFIQGSDLRIDITNTYTSAVSMGSTLDWEAW